MEVRARQRRCRSGAVASVANAANARAASTCSLALAGVKVVSDNFKLQWPAGKWDLCGDAHNAKKKFFNQFRYIAGARPQHHQCPAASTAEKHFAASIHLTLHLAHTRTETYLAGSTIEVHQLITANHAGRITLRVCPHDATSANYQQVCKVLQR